MSGRFGTGAGDEMSPSPESVSGSYEAVWVRFYEVHAADTRPAALAEMLCDGALPEGSFALVEDRT